MIRSWNSSPAKDVQGLHCDVTVAVVLEVRDGRQGVLDVQDFLGDIGMRLFPGRVVLALLPYLADDVGGEGQADGHVRVGLLHLGLDVQDGFDRFGIGRAEGGQDDGLLGRAFVVVPGLGRDGQEQGEQEEDGVSDESHDVLQEKGG